MPAIVKSVGNMLARAAPILERLPKSGQPRMVEVGVSTGLMAAHLLTVRSDLIWTGIDPWLGCDALPSAYIDTNDTHAKLNRNDAELNMRVALRKLEQFGHRATVKRERSPEAASRFLDKSQHIVFLDGDHSYDGTVADLRAWWPKVTLGGWLGGHDFANPDPRFRFGVESAVRDFSEEIGQPFEISGGLTYWFQKPT